MTDAEREKSIDPVVKTLLAAIAEEDQSGPFLRYDVAYDQIQEARRADENLPRGIWEIDLKKADWSLVIERCQNVLLHQSKDLQVAAWLTEAWLNVDGIPGMTRGLSLICELSHQYWETVHPQVENNDYEFRMAPLEWINDRLAEEIRFVKITAPSDQSIQAYTWADIFDANTLEANARRHREGQKLVQQAESEGKPTSSRIALSINQTPTTFFKKLVLQVQDCLATLQGLEAALFELCPSHLPSFYRIRAVLVEIQRYAKGHLDERQPQHSSGITEIFDESEGESPLVSSEALQLLPITSRVEAYARLTQAAEYLLRTEPHSPTPYLVKRAVKWGQMPLAELYQEIVPEDRDLTAIRQLLGFSRQKDKNVA